MLRHIGLGRVYGGQQLGDVFLSVAQRADDLQPHGRGHGLEQLGRTLENAVILKL
ncbi:hypothetical protein SDC9_212421 [bioreactor metagenome]|uniref:Uncharacterized protein n=1 Tax=bioreactor metagenome TaxID=1076179 RepID=A0A645JLW8_9ZZZZ